MVRELLDSAPDPDVGALVNRDVSTQDEITFRTGAVIRAMPCSARSTRGLPISLLILDEAAHMMTTEGGFAAGRQVYRALVPSTAQFGDRGYVMLTSSPLWCSGIFWVLYQGGVTGAAGDVFVARRPTWEMNPAVTRESLEFECRSDPDSARVEYGAEFMEGAGAFLAATAIQECAVTGRRALPRSPTCTTTAPSTRPLPRWATPSPLLSVTGRARRSSWTGSKPGHPETNGSQS